MYTSCLAKPCDHAVIAIAEVAAEFNRRNRVQLVVSDPALAGLPIGASFRSDNVEGFVRLLEASFGVRAERDLYLHAHCDEVALLHLFAHNPRAVAANRTRYRE